MNIVPQSRLLPVALTALFLASGLLALLVFVESRSGTGVTRYVEICGSKEPNAASCGSLAGVKAEFGFDLHREIATAHQRMIETAQKIAAGKLTEKAYRQCLEKNQCAEVPMLDPAIDPESPAARTPENARISAMFWHLAEDKILTEDICGLIPVCAAALKGGVIAVEQGKIRDKKP